MNLINESAGLAFYLLQHMLLDDIQLTISRLGDPEGTGKRQNLTLKALQRELRSCMGESSSVMDEPIEKFDMACGKIRERRNKQIAHLDLETALDRHPELMSGPTLEEIDGALNALGEAMSAFSLSARETAMAYELTITHADGETLIKRLQEGLRYRELVEEGTVHRHDFLDRFHGS